MKGKERKKERKKDYEDDLGLQNNYENYFGGTVFGFGLKNNFLFLY